MSRLIWRVLAIILIAWFFTPLPGGTLSLTIGLSILICASLPFALWVQACRRRFNFVNKSLTRIEEKLGERWAGRLMVTRPERDPRVHFETRD